MKIHRFIGEFKISEKNILIEDKNIVHQIHTVLRIKEGEKIVLCDGKNTEATYEIQKISKKEILLSRMSEPRMCPKPNISVTLFASILKKDNFELVVAKATEIGVAKIVPIITERTIKQSLNIERLKKIALESSELCGRGEVPNIEEVKNFDEIIKTSSAYDEAWIFDISGEPSNKNICKTRAILVGPEGGFTENEIEKAKKEGWKIVGISNLTLRGETAGIVGTYLAINF